MKKKQTEEEAAAAARGVNFSCRRALEGYRAGLFIILTASCPEHTSARQFRCWEGEEGRETRAWRAKRVESDEPTEFPVIDTLLPCFCSAFYFHGWLLGSFFFNYFDFYDGGFFEIYSGLVFDFEVMFTLNHINKI